MFKSAKQCPHFFRHVHYITMHVSLITPRYSLHAKLVWTQAFVFARFHPFAARLSLLQLQAVYVISSISLTRLMSSLNNTYKSRCKVYNDNARSDRKIRRNLASQTPPVVHVCVSATDDENQSHYFSHPYDKTFCINVSL